MFNGVSWSLSRPSEPSLAAVSSFEALIADVPFADAVLSATDDREPHSRCARPAFPLAGRPGRPTLRSEQTVGGSLTDERLSRRSEVFAARAWELSAWKHEVSFRRRVDRSDQRHVG